MLLITGATGHFGKATIESLLKKGVAASNIAALVRDENKAADLKALGVTIKTGDYDQPVSLEKAFAGVEKLLLVSSNDIGNRLPQHENVVKAAVKAGVKHIVYTSFARKNETESSPINFVAHSHIGTENLIKASGIPYTLLLNSLYMDVLPMFLGDKVLETGVFLPAGAGKTAFATRNDMAEAAAVVLTGNNHANKAYIIANTENYTLQDVATILGGITGKNVPYTSPTVETYQDVLKNVGVPAPYITLLTGFSLAIQEGEFETHTTDLDKLLGRKPTSLKEYLTGVYGK